MLITVVCDVLGAENNGTTIAAMNLIRCLRSKGHTVRILCPDADKKNDKDCYIVPTYNFGILNGYVAKNGVSIARAKKDVILRAIDGVDIVHIMTPFFLGHATAKLAAKQNIPISAGFHCQAENFTNHIFMMNATLINKLAYRVFYRVLYKYCNAIHYPTQFICDIFEKEVGPTNHYVISNGVNNRFVPLSAPKAPHDKFTIVFTGRYSREKSHKVLINGAALSKHKDDIQLIFAGDGPQKKNLQAYAKRKLTVAPIFNFFSREKLVEILQNADLYVHPAEIEIEAIACLEAISCQLVPVIADSPRSATRFFALNDNNRFHFNNPADLARKIDWWIEHPEELKACSEEYAGFAKQFNFEDCMNAMEAMLIQTVESKAHERTNHILQ